jgi:DNA-binding NtrC family response regulator
MTNEGVYETRDYMLGCKMADLAPRAENPAKVAGVDRNGSPRAEWPLTGMAVLVLDDDLTVLSSLADVLRAERCLVHTAARPSSALGILRNVKIEAVISDVVMPEMDGYEFYTRVKGEMPSLPVILMTAYNYDKDHIIKRSRVEGLAGALYKKPVNPTKLREVLLQIRRERAVEHAAHPR